MTLPLVWIPAANADLQDARAWYGNIRPALGERFAHAVEATVEAIVQNPLRFPIAHRQLRRAGVWRFPYGIFFAVEERQITVMACFHGRRNPKHWQSR